MKTYENSRIYKNQSKYTYIYQRKHIISINSAETNKVSKDETQKTLQVKGEESLKKNRIHIPYKNIKIQNIKNTYKI